MGMIDKLQKVAPNTTSEFLVHMMKMFGADNFMIEQAPISDRYIEVLRFFGYPLEIPSNTPVNKIIAHIKKLFINYENTKKNSDGIDFLKNLLYISKEERAKIMPEIFELEGNKRMFLQCLVPVQGMKLRTFMNCFVPRIKSIEEIETHFWNQQVFKEILPACEIPF